VDRAQGYLLASPTIDLDVWQEWWTLSHDTAAIETSAFPWPPAGI
jgi:hypothetical protein